MIHLSQIFRGVIVLLNVGQRRVDRGRETPDVLDAGSIAVAALQVLVQHGEYLGVQYLETPDSVHHAFQVLNTSQFEKLALLNVVSTF